jgi:predicted DNA-binding transcriptional regulator YafY
MASQQAQAMNGKHNADAIAAIKKRLQRKTAATVHELAELGQCDVRSVYRYLRLLEDQGEPIVKEGSRRPARYRILDS